MENQQPNKTNRLQFTELTQDDIIENEGWYIELLAGTSANNYKLLTPQQRTLLRDYHIKELQKANDLFVKMFK